MRTIKGQNFPQDGDDAKFPDGQIKNQTATQPGTPVVRELYGDIVTNVYKILRYAGITANELEDSEVNGYQLLNALKRFANELNDLQQVLTIEDDFITVQFNFDALPENYIFIGKISESVIAGQNYTFKGLGDEEYSLISPKTILASSLVLFTINSTGCSISQLNQNSINSDKYIITPFGTPLSSNDSDKMLYYSDGVLFDDSPKSYLIRNKIQTFSESVDVEICDVIFHKKHLICLTFDTSSLKYKIYCFNENDFNTVLGASLVDIDDTGNNFPYMFADSNFVYFSNSVTKINESSDDFSFGKFLFIPATQELTFASSFEVKADFQKTTNSFVTDDKIFTFISGVLLAYEFGLDSVENLGFFNTIDGVVFKFNGSTYYSNGETAVKWQY